MRPRRASKLLVEPPSVATGDIAFNLIVFFLVCASTQPDSGRSQVLPRAEQTKQQEQRQNLEVVLTRDRILLDGQPATTDELEKRLLQRFRGKKLPEDRIVVLKSDKSSPYHLWMSASIAIERAGGTITIQREETKTQVVP